MAHYGVRQVPPVYWYPELGKLLLYRCFTTVSVHGNLTYVPIFWSISQRAEFSPPSSTPFPQRAPLSGDTRCAQWMWIFRIIGFLHPVSLFVSKRPEDRLKLSYFASNKLAVVRCAWP